MSACEKCWGDAFMMAMNSPSKDQAECYSILLEQRKDTPCSPYEQAGQFWDEKRKCDKRLPYKDN